MDNQDMAKELLMVDVSEAESFGFALLEKEGFGAFPNPKKAFQRSVLWLSEHYDIIRQEICDNKKIITYAKGDQKDQELVEAVSSVLIDLAIFQGLPVSHISNLVVKKGVRELCECE